MRVLIPVPDQDFDTTEVAVPWRLLSRADHEVVFATESGGTASACDPRLLSGVLFGQLGADAEPKQFYEELTRTAEFRLPVSWRNLAMTQFDGLILPGGHAPGMRQYLAQPGAAQQGRGVLAAWPTRRGDLPWRGGAGEDSRSAYGPQRPI